MPVLQTSKSRGTYRLADLQNQGLGPADVLTSIQQNRPNPIKVGWTTYDIALIGGGAPLPMTGYGPGSLYYILPSIAAVNAGQAAVVQTWLLTRTPQPAGIGNWVLVSSLNIGATIQSSGGGGDSGSGGGDGGDG